MIFDLTNPLDVQRIKTRLEMLARKGRTIELKEKKVQRSLPQNKYLHLILGYFASQTGYRVEEVKKNYYKELCNPDLFIIEREYKFIGKKKDFKSSKDLTTEEMSLSIERFRNWAASEAGIYLPPPTNEEELKALEIEVERYKTYL